VGCWIVLSWALGIYFQHFAKLNKTYGTLAAAIALMVWLYWTAFAILLGGEINADLLEEEGKRIKLKQTASGEKAQAQGWKTETPARLKNIA
jgi:uncharacterized BrkB/YihY/UPF0761 family membrane protein